MGLFSDLISAVGNVFGGGNNSAPAPDQNNPLKKQQNNTSLPTTNLVSQKINMPVRAAPIPIAPTPPINLPITAATIPLAAPNPLNTQIQPAHSLVGAQSPIGVDPIGNLAQSVIKGVVGIPKAVGDTANEAYQLHVANNPTAALNSGKAAMSDLGQTGSLVKTGVTDPLAEIANTILHPTTQNTYQPTGRISTDIFGNNGIENVNKNVATNFDKSQGNLVHRISSAALDAIGQGAKIASVVAPVIKGAGAVGDVVHGDAPAFSLSPSNVTNATKVALANNAVEGAKALPTADETAPTATENTPPPESGTKAPTEPAPTNAPASETAEPTPAPGATESGIKPVETTPVAPTTTEKVNALPTEETPPVTTDLSNMALPTTSAPADVAAEQAAVQDALDKTAANIPAPVAPPATATADITPEQAAAEVAAQKQVTEEAPAVTFKKTDNPLKSEKPVNPYGINPVEGLSDEEAANGKTTAQTPDRAKLLSPRAQLTRSGSAGRQILQLFRNKEFNEGRLTTAMENETPTFHDLSPKDQTTAAKVVRGEETSTNPKINQAAQELQSHFKNVLQARDAAGVEGGDLGEKYIPQMVERNYFDKTANYNKAVQRLIDKGYSEENAVHEVNQVRSALRSAPNRAGNLELPREFEDPDQNFNSAKLRAYNEQAASRIAEAQHYGANNEELDRLTGQAAKNGEDVTQIKKIVDEYMHPKSVSKGPLSKLATGVRGVTNVALLPKAALSHTFQGLQNTASDVGMGNYFKALGNKMFSSDEKSFIDDSGIKNIKTEERSKLDKVTAPGLKQLRSFHQQVAVLAGKYHADALAAKGDEAGLRKIGVTGDLEKGADGKIPLTRTQQLQAGKVESDKSIFSDSSLETSKMLQGQGGKALGQFRTAYTAKQGGRIVDLVKQARNGDVAPLLKYLTVGVPVGGVGTLALKNLYTKGNPNPFPSGTSKTSDLLNVAQDSGVESVGFGAPESAINAARYNYNNNDRVNNAAGAVSPVAGIATEAGQNIDQALRGNDKPLIKQGASYVPLPVVPGKIDQRFAPTKAITPEEQNYFNKQGPAYTKMTNIINPFNKSATNQNTKTTAIITSLIKSDHNAQGQSIELTPAETQNKWTTISALPPKAQNAYIEYNKSLPDHSPAYDLTGNGTVIGIDGQPSTASKFQIYATYEKDLPGSAERSQLEANNPWLTQTFAAEQALYNSNSYKSNSVPSNDPLPGGVTQKDLTYPTISPATNDLMTQATQLASILPADRTPEQETQLQTIENNPDLQAAYSSLDNYTNAQRVARGAPPLKLAPNASPAVQAGINAYDALPPSKSAGNTDSATNGLRSAWILANPALYAQMSNYYASSDMATIASQGAKDELQGNAPSQSLLGAIKSAGTNDIASSKNANGTTSYSIDPAAAYAQSGSSGSSYTSPSTLAYDRDKAAGFSDDMKLKSAVNIKSVNGLKAGTDKYKEPKLIANKAPTGKNGNPFVQSITDTKGVKIGKGSNIFGNAISTIKGTKTA